MEFLEDCPSKAITLRHPRKSDAAQIYQLIKQSPPLDLNSEYLYFLQVTHFSQTCLVAECADQLLGFISGYRQPSQIDQLFIWQVAVAASARGQGLATRLLTQLAQTQSQPLRSLFTTIGPSNLASKRLFEAFAAKYQLAIEQSAFINPDDFSQTGHEAEIGYQLTPPQFKSIQETLSCH
jgi:L-2,4-diaminobutyric acid acetyltransferase